MSTSLRSVGSVRSLLPVLVAGLVAAPVSAHAQRLYGGGGRGFFSSPKEYGIDAGLTTGLNGDSYTNINLPAQRLRVGFFASPRVSIEPYGALSYVNAGGADATNLSLGTGLLYHFQPLGTPRQVYVRPFAELNHVSAGDNEHATQVGLGAGLGIRVPFSRAVATRLEANVGHAFSSDNRASDNRASDNRASDNRASGTSLGLLAGLSFLTR